MHKLLFFFQYITLTIQVNYAEILDRVQPLKEEVAKLEAAADELQKQADALLATIGTVSLLTYFYCESHYRTKY